MDEDVDNIERGLPTVTTGGIPAHARAPVDAIEKQLAMYAELKEDMRSSIAPALLARNDQAFSQAINRVLTGFGLDRKSAWQHEPEPAVAPATNSDNGAITFTGSPFAWLRSLFRRGK